MERADKGLTELLQYENVAWYENGKLRILDRRVYPIRKEYVICETYQDAVQAISDMVTQSIGPYMVIEMGMALAAYQAQDMNKTEAEKFLQKAVEAFSAARRTTTGKYSRIASAAYEVAVKAREKGKDAAQEVFHHAVLQADRRYRGSENIAKSLLSLLPDKGAVITQCYAEPSIAFLFRMIHESGRDIKVFCAETRPYFQGARLTASVARDSGLDVTVISDNMIAYTIQEKNITAILCGSDVICQDGTVFNKVGTLQMSLCAKWAGIPVYVTGSPSPIHKISDSVVIEERDPEQVLSCMGIKLTKEGVKGFYPAFDKTPPELIRAIITEKGVFKPEEVRGYFSC